MTSATRFHPPHSNNALGPGFSLCSIKDVFGTPCSLATFLINNPSYMAFLHSALPALTTVRVLHLDESPLLYHVRHVCLDLLNYSLTLDEMVLVCPYMDIRCVQVT